MNTTRYVLTFKRVDFFGNIVVTQRPVERECYSVEEKFDNCREMLSQGYELDSIRTEVLGVI